MIKSLHLFNIVKCFLHLPLIAFMYLTWSKSDFAILNLITFSYVIILWKRQ